MTIEAMLWVVTINRNTGDAALRTAQSVHEQSATFTWVVIDGASSDHSKDILQAHLRPGDVFISEPDSGIADAFNKGLAHCGPGGVVFLNAGDSLHDPRSLQALAAAWAGGQHPWVTGGAAVFAEAGAPLFTRGHHPAATATALLQRGCRIWHAATLVDRSLFAEFGSFDQSFGISMDYELWLRLQSKGHAPFIVPDLICDFRLGGISANLNARLVEDRRARQLHHCANSWWVETRIGTLTKLKRALAKMAGPWLYRLKERFRL